ncbi:hypothetical protein ACTFIW_010591 [Dictyostelium discoideum]
MRTLKLIILLILSTFNTINSTNIKISECGKARGVPNGESSTDGGQCGLPLPGVIGTAALNVFAFDKGSRCGECYELTGPLGSTVVMITDGCDAGDACQQKELFNFIISKKDFNKIGNSSAYGNIYSLGYQKVSCGFSGYIKAVFGGGSIAGRPDYSYYFHVSFSNFNIGIKQVQLMGTGMSRISTLKRDLGKYTWNQEGGGAKLQFPATLILTGIDGQTLSYKFNKPPSGQMVDIKKQFAPPTQKSSSALVLRESENKCEMGKLPDYVYQESLGLGWVTYFSWKFVYINLESHETNKKASMGKNLIQVELKGYGGLHFTREGGFQTKYIKSLSFTIRAAPPISALQVYVGQVGSYTLPTLGWQWTEITIPASKIKSKNDIEYSLSFYNNKNQTNTLWIDNIKWNFTPNCPPTPAFVTDKFI